MKIHVDSELKSENESSRSKKQQHANATIPKRERKELSRERGRFSVPSSDQICSVWPVASATIVLRVARRTRGMSPVARGTDSMKTYVSTGTRGCSARARARGNISRPIRHRAPTFIVSHGDFSLWVEVAPRHELLTRLILGYAPTYLNSLTYYLALSAHGRW